MSGVTKSHKLPPRVLIVGSGRRSTGFGRVITSISDELAADFDIHVFAYDVFKTLVRPGPWTLHTGINTDTFGLSLLPLLVERLLPDLVLVVNDYWFLPAFCEQLSRCNWRAPVIAYIPVDLELTDRRLVDRLEKVDVMVVYSKFALETLRSVYCDGATPPRSLCEAQVIPHGSSERVFNPRAQNPALLPLQADRIRSREAVFSSKLDDVSGFWVLNANKNSRRKRIDITMQAFALFAQDKPANIRLWLHSAGSNIGPNLRRFGRELGISDRLIFSEDIWGHAETSLETLNLVYNCCDVGLNTCVGEGWGLVSFEHAATGAAQIVPRHSALDELWRDSAEFIDSLEPFPMSRFLVGYAPTVQGVAAALERLYSDDSRLRSLSAAAYRNATRSEYSWDTIALRWSELFRTVLRASELAAMRCRQC